MSFVIISNNTPKNSFWATDQRPPVMSDSEVICILMLFHLRGFRCLKHFYLFYVQQHMQDEFPKTVSYNLFVELSQKVVMSMTILLKTCYLGVFSGISLDSTPIRVCKNKRIKRNNVFKGIAEVGKSTMGWFYDFKFHIVINDKGEILNLTITQANVDDRELLKNKDLGEFFIRETKDILNQLCDDFEKHLINMEI